MFRGCVNNNLMCLLLKTLNFINKLILLLEYIEHHVHILILLFEYIDVMFGTR